MKLHSNVTDPRSIRAFDKFVKLVAERHGDSFDHSKVIYLNAKAPITVTCNVCGTEKTTTPDTHKRTGCAVCSHKKQADDQRLTTEKFIEKSKRIHGDKFDYSMSNYVSNETILTIKCPEHGLFNITPAGHWVSKTGCLQCGIKAAWITRGISTEDYIASCQEVHGKRYDYSSTVYTESRNKVDIICRVHGVFSVGAAQHKAGGGCPKCSILTNSRKRRLSQEEVVSRFIEVQGTRYNYDLVDYKGTEERVEIICPKHESFWQIVNNHFQGMGCPRCKTSTYSPDEPTLLYYLRVDFNGIAAYKIGITKYSVNKRYTNTELERITILQETLYDTGLEAYEEEQNIISQYKAYRYYGPDLLISGNTELFSIDVLNLNKQGNIKMNILANIISNMSEADKQKLGQTGTRINSDGSHLVSITNFYIGDYEGDANVQITFEDAAGKSVEWSGSLVGQVNVDKDGKPTRKSYTLNGQPLANPAKGDKCDNLATLGKIKNLCELLGTSIEEASTFAVEETVTSFGKDITVPVYKSLIGKSLTIVTSTQVAADAKNPNQVWRNQVVSMTYIFNKSGLNAAEVAAGKTEPSAINAAIKLAKAPAEQYADIGYSIKYGHDNNKAVIQEYKLLGQSGSEPTTTDVSSADPDEDVFN